MAGQAAPGMTILVPSDGSAVSARALPYALALASEEAAEIILLMVIEKEEPIRNLVGRVTESSEDLTRKAIKQAKEELLALGMTVEGTVPVQLTHLVRVGDPAKQIGAVAEEVEADLLVMSSHGRGAAGRWTFGSVADQVARSPGPPVMIVRVAEGQEPQTDAGGRATIKRLIVPVDGSDLSKCALPVAADLAHRLGVPLTLMMAVDLPRSGSAIGMNPGWEFEVGELLEEMEQEAERVLTEVQDTVLKQHGDLIVSHRVLRGPAAGAIIRETAPDDVVVMSSRGRGGVARVLLGSVAEQLVRAGHCPVLLVRAAIHEKVETTSSKS